jgi:hypothetical protein
MRKIAIFALAASLFTSACASSQISQTEQAIITDVQAITVPLCGFLPAAASIGSIFLAGDPALATAEQIANAVCAAVNGTAPPAAARAMRKRGNGLPAIIVNGRPVVVNGSYVTH